MFSVIAPVLGNRCWAYVFRRKTRFSSIGHLRLWEISVFFCLFAGEVHLQKCLTDLSDMGQTNIKVSEPIVSFLETVVPSPPGTATGTHETVS